MEKSIKICSGSIPLPQKFPGKRNAALSYGADYGIILYHKITLPVYGAGNLVRKHMKHGLIVFLVSMVPLIELRGRHPLRRGLRDAAVADVSHCHRGEYAAGAVYLSLRPEDPSLGQG